LFHRIGREALQAIMRLETEATLRCRNGIAVFTAMIVAVIVAGCGGGTQSPPAVQLALTAPTEGAEVAVRNIKVFGTVDPASATVLVAGKHVRVEHGVFAQWTALRKGLSHIKIMARAPGYLPANLSVAVTSSPGARPSRASSGASTGERTEGTATTSIGNPTPPPAGSEYEPRVRTTFVRACELAAGEGSSAEAACNCALSHVEAVASQSTLQATELAIDRGEATVPQWLRNAARDCKKP
jgi:hypothetical protein